MFSFSVWVFIIGLAQQLRLNIMPTILGITADTTEISIFSVGRNIEGLVFTISFALNGLFLPKVTRMITSNNMAEVGDLMIRVGRIQLFIVGAILMTFFIFGDAFVNLWVGDVFIDVYYIVILLTITNIVSLTQTIANDVIYVKNKVKYSAIITIITSLLSFVLAIVLSSNMGALGCAIAISIGLLLYLFIMNIFYSRKLQIPMWNFFKNCHLKILPLLLLLTTGVYFIRKQLVLDNWIILIGAILIYLVLYCGISYFFLFNKEEKELVLSVLKLGKK